jgi:putative nucleotidyltransferase with HDIG domain
MIQRILIVDDEEGFRGMLQGMLLKLHCFQCDTAPGASEALDKLAKHRYDLVISDIRMPGSDGLQFMIAAKEKYPELDFIIMTAHTADYEFSDIISAGATDFIAKPFTWGELVAKVERIEKEQNVLRDLREANLELSESFDRLKWVLEDSVKALGAVLEMKDPYTAGHQKRVSDIACKIAGSMELSHEQITAIRLAGLVHDIGKISVPSEILSKPSKLDELEFALIKRHPSTGFDILKRISFPWPMAKIVLQHHERLDGSGYPTGLSSDEILIEARIIAVADVVEAMSSHRPHRPALGVATAFAEIGRNRGALYDAFVVDACLRLKDYCLCLDSSRIARHSTEAALSPE